jgi:hypothetical protein
VCRLTMPSWLANYVFSRPSVLAIQLSIIILHLSDCFSVATSPALVQHTCWYLFATEKHCVSEQAEHFLRLISIKAALLLQPHHHVAVHWIIHSLSASSSSSYTPRSQPQSEALVPLAFTLLLPSRTPFSWQRLYKTPGMPFLFWSAPKTDRTVAEGKDTKSVSICMNCAPGMQSPVSSVGRAPDS